VKVAPVEPAMRTRVSYCRKFGGRPYGPSTKTTYDFPFEGSEVVGRDEMARLYSRRLNPAFAWTTKVSSLELGTDAIVNG
jgi:hypothetical protein